jgi:hypothetical protein
LKRKENEDYYDTNTNFTPFQFKVDRWYLKIDAYKVAMSPHAEYLNSAVSG